MALDTGIPTRSHHPATSSLELSIAELLIDGSQRLKLVMAGQQVGQRPEVLLAEPRHPRQHVGAILGTSLENLVHPFLPQFTSHAGQQRWNTCLVTHLFFRGAKLLIAVLLHATNLAALVTGVTVESLERVGDQGRTGQLCRCALANAGQGRCQVTSLRC